MLPSSAFLIPQYLKAGSPSGLRRLMLLASAKTGMHLKFSDIQCVMENGKPQWYAWYYAHVDENDLALPPKEGAES